MNRTNRMTSLVVAGLAALAMANCALLAYILHQQSQADGPTPTAVARAGEAAGPIIVPPKAQPTQPAPLPAATWPSGCPYTGDWERWPSLDASCRSEETGPCRVYVGPGVGADRILLALYDGGMAFDVPLTADDDMLRMFAAEVAATAIDDCGVPAAVVNASAEAGPESHACVGGYGWCYRNSIDYSTGTLQIVYLRIAP